MVMNTGAKPSFAWMTIKICPHTFPKLKKQETDKFIHPTSHIDLHWNKHPEDIPIQLTCYKGTQKPLTWYMLVPPALEPSNKEPWLLHFDQAELLPSDPCTIGISILTFYLATSNPWTNSFLSTPYGVFSNTHTTVQPFSKLAIGVP